tara:strand:- start:532 stop:729 length:198 start_codon:yes stop_codon:yes gene_type:complete
MTINEAFNKVKSICFTRIVELETEAEKIKDIDKLTANTLTEEKNDLAKALHFVQEYFKNSVDDGK